MPFINDKIEFFAKQQKELEETHQARDLELLKGVKKRGVPSRFKFDVHETMGILRSCIHGQEQAMCAIENMLKIVKADIADPEKPLYVGLFLGPTGVGKTEIVRVLAETIHGSRNKFCRVDMNTLSQEHYAAALTGAPPGYVGSKEGSTLLDKEHIEGSFSRPGIILFDEIEKASNQVIQTLLNVFDNGMMTIASGDDTINFRNTIIMITSNLGAKDIYNFMDKRLSFFLQKLFNYLSPKNWGKQQIYLVDNIIKRNLENVFKPEFINRIDEIVTFNWLEKDVINQIISNYLVQLNQKLQKYNCELRLEPSAIQFLSEKGYDKRYGARALKRELRRYLEVPFAEMLIEQTDFEKPVIYIVRKFLDKNRLSITLL